MQGETVIVERRIKTGTDSFNNGVFKPVSTPVDNVLVIPSPSSDVKEGNRPAGRKIAYTLHFPKTYNVSLAGAYITVRNKRLKVVGDPSWYTPQNTPGPWNYPIDVEAVDG